MSTRKIIFVYSSTYLPVQGGIQYYLYWKLKWLDQNLGSLERLKNTNVVFITSSRFLDTASIFKNINVFFIDHKLGFLGTLVQLINIINNYSSVYPRPRVIIHSHGFGRDGLISNIASLLTKSISILTAHGEDIAYIHKFAYGARLTIKGRLIARINAFLADHATTISKDMVNFLSQLMSHQKISLVPNFYDKDVVIPPNLISESFFDQKYKMKDNRFNLLTLSGARRIKGHANLIYAFKNFLLRFPESKAVLYIAAHGDESNIIQTQVNQLQISDSVCFTGFITGDEKSYCFRHADVYINSAYFEPFGLVYLEAVQYSLPVIASMSGGGRDIFENGPFTKLIDPYSIDSIFQAIVELYMNQNRSLDNHYDHILEKYSPDNVMLKFLDIYDLMK